MAKKHYSTKVRGRVVSLNLDENQIRTVAGRIELLGQVKALREQGSLHEDVTDGILAVLVKNYPGSKKCLEEELYFFRQSGSQPEAVLQGIFDDAGRLMISECGWTPHLPDVKLDKFRPFRSVMIRQMLDSLVHGGESPVAIARTIAKMERSAGAGADTICRAIDDVLFEDSVGLLAREHASAYEPARRLLFEAVRQTEQSAEKHSPPGGLRSAVSRAFEDYLKTEHGGRDNESLFTSLKMNQLIVCRMSQIISEATKGLDGRREEVALAIGSLRALYSDNPAAKARLSTFEGILNRMLPAYLRQESFRDIRAQRAGGWATVRDIRIDDIDLKAREFNAGISPDRFIDSLVGDLVAYGAKRSKLAVNENQGEVLHRYSESIRQIDPILALKMSLVLGRCGQVTVDEEVVRALQFIKGQLDDSARHSLGEIEYFRLTKLNGDYAEAVVQLARDKGSPESIVNYVACWGLRGLRDIPVDWQIKPAIIELSLRQISPEDAMRQLDPFHEDREERAEVSRPMA